jgi:hypothetical protein
MATFCPTMAEGTEMNKSWTDRHYIGGAIGLVIGSILVLTSIPNFDGLHRTMLIIVASLFLLIGTTWATFIVDRIHKDKSNEQ